MSTRRSPSRTTTLTPPSPAGLRVEPERRVRAAMKPMGRPKIRRLWATVGLLDFVRHFEPGPVFAGEEAVCLRLAREGLRLPVEPEAVPYPIRDVGGVGQGGGDMAILDVTVELLVVSRPHGVDEVPVVRGLDAGRRQGVAAAPPAGRGRARRARPLFLASAQIALPVPAVAVAEDPALGPLE